MLCFDSVVANFDILIIFKVAQLCHLILLRRDVSKS